MKLTVSGGGAIEYELAGPRNALPVVFIHGFPFSREMWKPQAEALGRDFYVITYDVRGHGGSDAGDGQYTIELFADDLLALLDHLHVKTAAGVGLSMGGYILLRAAERHPERFRGLVLCDTRSEADGNEGKIKRARQVSDIKASGTKEFAENFLKAAFCEKTLAGRPEVVESIRSVILRTSPVAIAGTLIALAARTDSTPSLFRITAPALVMVGREDSVTPPSASQAMREKIPGAALHVIPDAGHLSNLENPGEFNAHLLAFLNKLKPTA
jgi:3-oxoadipate enol-lactonase